MDFYVIWTGHFILNRHSCVLIALSLPLLQDVSVCYMHLMYVCLPRWIQYFFLRKKSMYYSELLLKYILYVHSLHFY